MRPDDERIDALLRQLDHAPPAVTSEMVVARARAGGGWGRRAALIMAALGLAGAAYAFPGSPLPEWARTAARRIKPGPIVSLPAPAPTQVPLAPLAGIAVAPGRSLVILFTHYQAQGQVRVSLTDSARVLVQAPGGAATFTSEADRLVIYGEFPAPLKPATEISALKP